MIFCPKCGAQLHDDADGCNVCGFSFAPENIESIEPLPQEEAMRYMPSSSNEDSMPDVSVAVTAPADYVSPLDDFGYVSSSDKPKEEEDVGEMPSISMPSIGGGAARPAPAPQKAPQDDYPTMPTLDRFSGENK